MIFTLNSFEHLNRRQNIWKYVLQLEIISYWLVISEGV